MEPQDDPEHATTLTAAEQLLSTSLGRDVRLGQAEQLSEDNSRNLLLRVRDLSGGLPASFIIKKVVAERYDPDDEASWDTRRLFNDWVGAQFLSTLVESPPTARFYGGNRAAGFIILEDLGPHRSLVAPLLGGDAASAERALHAHAAALGALHAATFGKRVSFERLYREVSGLPLPTDQRPPFYERVAGWLDGLGIRTESGFAREIAEVAEAIENPGPFHAYIHGDPCPDNEFWTGERQTLIDFEFGRYGHALLDGAYWRMIFPTCWCANRLPDAVVAATEATYRAALIEGCPEAADDRLFEGALARVCAFWLFDTATHLAPFVAEKDDEWGISTVRQRLLARTGTFIATAEAFNQLPALCDTASRLLEHFERAWPGTPPMPLFPALRGAGGVPQD